MHVDDAIESRDENGQGTGIPPAMRKAKRPSQLEPVDTSRNGRASRRRSAPGRIENTGVELSAAVANGNTNGRRKSFDDSDATTAAFSDDDHEDEGDTSQSSKTISATLLDTTIGKIIIGVLLLLFMVPATDVFRYDFSQQYGLRQIDIPNPQYLGNF